MRKSLALITVFSFLVTNVSFALDVRMSAHGSGTTLAAPLRSDPDILGKNPSALQRYHMTRIEYDIVTTLRDLAKTTNYTLTETLALLSRRQSAQALRENVAPKREGMYIFFQEAMPFEDGIRVMARVMESPEMLSDKVATYYTIVKPGEGGELSLKTYTKAEFDRTESFKKGLPERNPEDAAAIARDEQHEEGIDTVLRYAHEHGLAKKPLSEKFIFKNRIRILLRLLKVEVQTPKGLIPIEEREFYLVKKTPEILEMIERLPKAKVIDENGIEHDFVYNAHSSNNAVHVFLLENSFECMTNRNYAYTSRVAAEKTINRALSHEIGVMLGLPILQTADELEMGISKRTHLNILSKRYVDIVKNQSSYGINEIRATVVDLRGLETRDFAMGPDDQPTSADRDFLEKLLGDDKVRVRFQKFFDPNYDPTIPGQKTAEENNIAALIDEVGKAIAPPVSKHTVFVAYNLYRNLEEEERDRNERFDIVRIMTSDRERIVDWILDEIKRKGIEPENAVVQLPEYFSHPDYIAHLDKLTRHGIRCLIVDTNGLTFIEDAAKRAEYRENILAMLQLARNVVDENSKAYPLLRYYIEGHLKRFHTYGDNITEEAISLCLVGIINNDPSILGQFVFSFKPVGRFENRPYRHITATLRSA